MATTDSLCCTFNNKLLYIYSTQRLLYVVLLTANSDTCIAAAGCFMLYFLTTNSYV